MTETVEQTLSRLSAENADLKARLDRVDPKPKVAEVTPVDVHLRRALTLTKTVNGFDIDAAADLFNAWTQQDSDVRASVKPLVREALERRLELLKQS